MLRKDWVRLTKGQRRAIRYRLRRAGSAAERRRLNAVALYDAGQSMEAIAETLCCSVGSISLDLRRWRTERFSGLAPKPCGGSEPKVSQEQFAALLGISVRTLRNWEQGRRVPEGPARVLLQVAAKHPEAVLDVVQAKAE